MAWPKNLENITCIGFPAVLLPLVINAIDSKQVEWAEVSMFCESCSAKFHYLGCKWELNEFCETVQSIRFVKGVLPKNEELTAAVLRG